MTVSVSVSTTGALERRMEVSVPAERVEKALDLRLRSFTRTARIKGFRPGKAPANVVRRQFGAQLRDEVVTELVRETFGEAIVQEKVALAAGPRIEPISTGSGEDLKYAAIFEIYPEFEVQGADGMEVVRATAEVGPADIDAMIENLRKQRPDYVAVERGAGDKDRITVDFEGRLDGVPFEGGKGEAVPVVLGQGRMIADFEAGLQGAKPGETRTFPVKFPDEYQQKTLAGKTAEFTATVKAVEEEHLPEVNDEFCKAFGVESGGIEQLRTEVGDNMRRELAQTLQGRLKQQVIDKLATANPIDVPSSLLEQTIRELQMDMLRRMGVREPKELPPREPFVEPARKRVAVGLVLNELIQKQAIKLDGAQLEKRINETADGYSDPAEAGRQIRQNQQMLQNLQAAVIEGQAIDWILARAKVTEQPTTFAEVMKFGTNS